MCSRLLSEILKETNEDIEEIEYLTDGSWRPIRDDKEKDRERERSNTPEYPVVDICTSNFNPFLLKVQISFFPLWNSSAQNKIFVLWTKDKKKCWPLLRVCRHSWSKRSLARPQQHEPVWQIWKWLCRRGRRSGGSRGSARRGSGGRPDSGLLLWRGRGRGGGRQRGHGGQCRQPHPEARPIQLWQGPGDGLLTPPALSLQRLMTQTQRQTDRQTGCGGGNGAGRAPPTSRTGTQSSNRCNDPPHPMPTRQSLLAALDAVQTNTLETRTVSESSI